MKNVNPNTAKKLISVTLTALGSAGVCVTGYLSAKAGIAIKDIALDEGKSKEEKKKEIIKEAIPVGLSAGATIGCIISSNVISSKTAKNIQMEMAAGYSLLQNAYYQYRKKIDAETHDRVLKQISKEKVKEIVYVEGKYAWVDDYHTEPWYATEADVFWAEIKIKELFNKNLEVSLGDFYRILREERGVDIPYVPNENDLIWNVDVLIEEWESTELVFGNLYENTEDGGRIYTLDFYLPPYPSIEVEKILKKIGAYYA